MNQATTNEVGCFSRLSSTQEKSDLSVLAADAWCLQASAEGPSERSGDEKPCERDDCSAEDEATAFRGGTACGFDICLKPKCVMKIVSITSC